MDYFVEDIVPCVACICCIISLNVSFPGCIGCSGKEELLCCHCNYFGCRVPEEDDRIWVPWNWMSFVLCTHSTNLQSKSFILRSSVVFILIINSYEQNDSQLFCCDILCSLPLSKEIPSLITCCFCTVI